MPHADLPESLGPAFLVGVALRAGASRSRLRSSDLEQTFHGARAVVGADLVADGEDDARRAYPRSPQVRRVHERAAQYAVVMSNRAFFSHVTAAALWDAPLPPSTFRRSSDKELGRCVFDPEVLEVSMIWPERAPRGAGVNGHAVRQVLASVTEHPVSGLRVADPATTWATLAGALPHPYDLVAVGDHFVRSVRPPHGWTGASAPDPLATLPQLIAAVDAGRRHGAAQLREALVRVRTGSASRPETWTRLTLIDGGLPEPVLDHDVFDDLGRFLGRVDMAYPRWRIAIEYEGVHHSSGSQWESDVDRYAALEAAGWRVIRVTKRMLFTFPGTLVQRVRSAIRERS